MLNYIKEKNPVLAEKIISLVSRGRTITVSGLTMFMRVLLVAFLRKYTGKKIFWITSGEQNSLRYQHDLSGFFGVEGDVFPYQTVGMYESIKQNPYDSAKQVEIINNISDKEIILATPKSLTEKLADKLFYEKNTIKVAVDDEIDTKEIAENLVALGYKRVTMVSDIGEFSVRGDIIDVFSLERNPFRIELWGDTVSDIRYFDNETQKSFQKTNAVKILPVYKFVVDNKSKNRLKASLKKSFDAAMKDLAAEAQALFEEKYHELFETIDNEDYFEGIEYFQNLLNPDLKGILELLSEDFIVILDESKEILSKYALLSDNLEKQYLENVKSLINFPLETPNHIENQEFLSELNKRQKIRFDNIIDFYEDSIIELENSLIPSFSVDITKTTEFIKEKLKSGYKVVVATNYQKRVSEIFDEQGILHSSEFGNTDMVYITDNISVNGAISEDFKLVVLSDKELFNKHSKDITAKRKSYYKEKADYIESINDIKEGDYVVHSIHGIGVYMGVSKQEIDGQFKDYLTIEYANKDKLHMPAEQINFLCRYRGSGSSRPKISRMGGTDWDNTRNKVKKAVEDVAYELLQLYAKRKVAEGIVFEPDTTWQYEMEDAFEYTPTPDQMLAINDTKSDMEEEKPMDRLVCGDVGFGKTEVAIRAIFKAVMSGKQCALIVPTTILAMQHFKTISERFKPYPIKIEPLSRFQSSKEQKKTVERLITGECDVVIGTHRLLQDDIKFKNIGLLVIDEEHRFGVRHKEKLKMLKKNIDILSMSATPIPRTLYMSLSGIKDMSVINTAPTNRLPIKTHVGEYSEIMVKNAIQHELDREGQVFFLYNRVETIDIFAGELRKLVPFAKIAVAHAKMDEKTLEKVMLDFSEGVFDVLVCTTIIESGLDIENANTIIIYDADRFGLAQLYQLRGRVGRSDRQAYCYCFYGKNKEITEDATSRLKAIKEFTTLGSGYQIAMRDIEIRGIGNILGTKQHGHMVDVGFDAYCQLLEEAITSLKGEKQEKTKPAIIDININAFIPDEWVGSKEQKMIEYKRLADVKDINELEVIVLQWKDRFSKIPQEVENLIELVKLRLKATDAGITIVRETPENIRIYTPYTRAEYRIIAQKLSTNITKYIKFTDAPKTCKDGASILLLDNSRFGVKEMFNILGDLFYYIHKVIYDYNSED